MTQQMTGLGFRPQSVIVIARDEWQCTETPLYEVSRPRRKVAERESADGSQNRHKCHFFMDL